MITPIEPLNFQAIEPLESLKPMQFLSGKQEASATEDRQTPFGAIFRSVVENVKETDSELAKDRYLLATGQLDNPAALMISASKNQVAVNLLIQLRNKALDAYAELNRISL